MQNHRGRARAPQRRGKPRQLKARKPLQVWSWDITWLPSPIKGRFFKLYMVIDIFSRYIVGWEVHHEETDELSAALFERICKEQGIDPGTVELRSDNGGAMKGATLLCKLQELGVAPSFSRPRVSDDNPFSEAAFRTLKYCAQYPRKPFASIEEAQAWVAGFVTWYNYEHRHSGIKFVTPHERHAGADAQILAQRSKLYERARSANPSRWSRNTRNWSRIDEVILSPLQSDLHAAISAAA